MPLQIVNQELYADRTVQNWHRTTFPKDFDAIDVDLLGYCHRAYCRKTLYVIEATTNPDKPLSVITQLAKQAGVVALMIQHDRNVIVRGKIVHPIREELTSEDSVTDAIRYIRAIHELQEHVIGQSQ